MRITSLYECRIWIISGWRRIQGKSTLECGFTCRRSTIRANRQVHSLAEKTIGTRPEYYFAHSYIFWQCLASPCIQSSSENVLCAASWMHPVRLLFWGARLFLFIVLFSTFLLSSAVDLKESVTDGLVLFKILKSLFETFMKDSCENFEKIYASLFLFWKDFCHGFLTNEFFFVFFFAGKQRFCQNVVFESTLQRLSGLFINRTRD